MALNGVKEAAVAQAERKKQATANQNKKYFKELKVGEDQEVQVRFLEQDEDFKFPVWVHRSVPFKKKSGDYFYKDMVCSDQKGDGSVECRGCEDVETNEDAPKRAQLFFVNVIWRNAPVYETDSKGKIVTEGANAWNVVDHQDVLAFWSKGVGIAEQLDVIDTRYKGLTSRDLVIHRTGTGYDTKYDIGPVIAEDGDVEPKKPLSAADKKLAADKFDLNEVIESKKFFTSTQSTEARSAPSSKNPFEKKKKEE